MEKYRKERRTGRKPNAVDEHSQKSCSIVDDILISEHVVGKIQLVGEGHHIV